jgi:hypothetical protein
LAGFTTSGQTGSQKWSALSWAALPEEAPLGSISHIVTWRHGYVGYGTGIWQSADGNAWQPASLTLADSLIAESPTGLLAVSHASDPQSAHEVWSSSDGLAWTKLPTPVSFDSTMILAIAGNEHSVVVVLGSLNGNKVLTSADGKVWAEVSLPSGTFCWCGTADTPVWAWAGAGRVFLAGYLSSGTADPGPFGFFSSSDGVAWAPSKTTFAGMPILHFAGSSVLADVSPNDSPFMEEWMISSDGGETWAKTTPQSAMLTSSGGALCANGERMLGVAKDGRAWTSRDGKTWSPLEWGSHKLGQTSDGQPEVFALKLFPTGVYVSGWYGSAS